MDSCQEKILRLTNKVYKDFYFTLPKAINESYWYNFEAKYTPTRYVGMQKQI